MTSNGTLSSECFLMCLYVSSHISSKNPLTLFSMIISDTCLAVFAFFMLSIILSFALHFLANSAKKFMSTLEPLTCVCFTPAAILANLPINPTTYAFLISFLAHCCIVYPEKSPICTKQCSGKSTIFFGYTIQQCARKEIKK